MINGGNNSLIITHPSLPNQWPYTEQNRLHHSCGTHWTISPRKGWTSFLWTSSKRSLRGKVREKVDKVGEKELPIISEDASDNDIKNKLQTSPPLHLWNNIKSLQRNPFLDFFFEHSSPHPLENTPPSTFIASPPFLKSPPPLLKCHPPSLEIPPPPLLKSYYLRCVQGYEGIYLRPVLKCWKLYEKISPPPPS